MRMTITCGAVNLDRNSQGTCPTPTRILYNVTEKPTFKIIIIYGRNGRKKKNDI